MFSLALALLLCEAPSPEQMAKLQHDIDSATSEVDKKYAGKELSPDDKKQQAKDRARAEQNVLEKAGVDRKDFARAGARMSKSDREVNAAEKSKLDKADKAAPSSGSGDGKGKEIVIEKGGAGAPKTDAELAAEADRQAGYGKTSSKSKKK